MPWNFYLNFAVALLAAIIGLVQQKKLRQGYFYLLIFVCIAAPTEFTTYILLYTKSITSTMPGVHVYLLVEFFLFSMFYLYILKDFIKKEWLIILCSIFLIYSVTNTLFIQSIFKFPNIPRAIEALILIFFSILYFARVMMEAKFKSLTKEPSIWINSAVLIYFSGNFFFNILFNLILEYSRDFSKLTTVYFAILNAIFYLLISVGFLKVNNKNKEI